MTFDNSTQATAPPAFDNTPPPAPSKWEMAKSHAPIFLIGAGVIVLFISPHTAAVAVAIAAGAHLLLGIALAAFGWFRNRGQASAGSDTSRTVEASR